MPRDVEALLLTLLRSRELRERMGPLVQALLLAQLLAGGGRRRPALRAARPPLRTVAGRSHRPQRGSVTGRRPRG